MLDSKSWMDSINEGVAEANHVKPTPESLLQALRDGRIMIPFTILQCVGYPEDCFEQLLYYEKHPKPKKTKGKRRGPKAQGSAKKQAKTPKKAQREVKEESSEDESDARRDIRGPEESDDSDSEYLEGPRQIAPLPSRASPRKQLRAISPEL
jgi:hypothetical protein